MINSQSQCGQRRRDADVSTVVEHVAKAALQCTTCLHVVIAMIRERLGFRTVEWAFTCSRRRLLLRSVTSRLQSQRTGLINKLVAIKRAG